MTRTDRIPMRTTSRITLLLLLIAGFALGRWAFPAGGKAPAASGESAAAAPAVEEIWTCAMHPQVRLPEPGQCPICGMDLIPADAGGGSSLGPRDLRMSPDAVALADIQTAKVVRRTVAHDVPMVGKVAYDETRVSTITTWVPGRLEKLFVDYTGVPVRKGEHLVEIYSPTLFSAQQELLQAIVAEKRIGRSSLDILHTASTATVTSTREKLRLYGMTDAQIEELVARGTPDERVTIYAPTGGIVIHKKALEGMYVDEGSEVYTIADLSKVWVFLDAYESDLVWLRYGQDVRFTVEAYPGRTLHGRVAFIDPSLDDRTRTVKVRLNVENEDGLLKPGMFVSAVAEARLSDAGKVVDTNLAGKWMCPMHPEVIGDGPESCPECGMELKPVEELGFITEPDGDPVLVIPATAPLLTGKRAVVYVKLPDREEPTFQGRVVTLGPRAGDWYVVEDGLEEGETVVVRGNFKIDSELQIRAQPSMMSPEGGSPPPGHNHGADMPGMEDTGTARKGASIEISDEDRTEVTALLENAMEAYLSAHDQLARDGDARGAAADFLSTLADPNLPEVLSPLRSAAEALESAEDIELQRERFIPLSRLYIDLIDATGATLNTGAPLGVYHCPMAGDDGADWVQPQGTTQNPYFGTSMSKCGSMTRELGGGQ